MNFEKELEHRTKEVETIVKSYLPEESGWAKTVMEAMNYSVNVAAASYADGRDVQAVWRRRQGD